MSGSRGLFGAMELNLLIGGVALVVVAIIMALSAVRERSQKKELEEEIIEAEQKANAAERRADNAEDLLEQVFEDLEVYDRNEAGHFIEVDLDDVRL